MKKEKLLELFTTENVVTIELIVIFISILFYYYEPIKKTLWVKQLKK